MDYQSVAKNRCLPGALSRGQLSNRGYHDIQAKDGGMLLFQLGTTGPAIFDVRSIDGDNDVQLRFEGEAEVRVSDKLSIGKSAYVGPYTGSVAARDIIFA
jgi:hypothetical protein